MRSMMKEERKIDVQMIAENNYEAELSTLPYPSLEQRIQPHDCIQDRVHALVTPINILTHACHGLMASSYLERVRSSYSSHTYPPTTESRALGTGLRDPVASGQDTLPHHDLRYPLDHR